MHHLLYVPLGKLTASYVMGFSWSKGDGSWRFWRFSFSWRLCWRRELVVGIRQLCNRTWRITNFSQCTSNTLYVHVQCTCTCFHLKTHCQFSQVVQHHYMPQSSSMPPFNTNRGTHISSSILLEDRFLWDVLCAAVIALRAVLLPVNGVHSWRRGRKKSRETLPRMAKRRKQVQCRKGREVRWHRKCQVWR